MPYEDWKDTTMVVIAFALYAMVGVTRGCLHLRQQWLAHLRQQQSRLSALLQRWSDSLNSPSDGTQDNDDVADDTDTGDDTPTRVWIEDSQSFCAMLRKAIEKHHPTHADYIAFTALEYPDAFARKCRRLEGETHTLKGWADHALRIANEVRHEHRTPQEEMN